MAGYTFSQIESLWTQNGGSPAAAPIAAAIAMAESGGNPQSLNNTPSTGDYSVGLWQINYFGNLDGPRTAAYGNPTSLAADPNAQAKAAISISGNGANWSPWSTYTSGAYKQYLSGGGTSSNTGGGATLTAASPTAGIWGNQGNQQQGIPKSPDWYRTSVVPGVPAQPPSLNPLGLDPITDLGSVLKFGVDFGGWALFTLVVLVFGLLLLALGFIMLVVLLAQPAVSPITDVVGGGLIGRATKGIRSGRSSEVPEVPESPPEPSSRGVHSMRDDTSQRARHAPGRGGMSAIEERQVRAQARENAPVRRAHSSAERRSTNARKRSRDRRPGDHSQLRKQRAG